MSDIMPIDLAQYPPIDSPARVLLGPGPSMVHPRVLRVMTAPMVGYVDPYYLHVMDQVQDLLRYLFQTKNEQTFTVSGTGSAGMETAIANMVEPGDSVLVCVNGYFGLRLAEMARRADGAVATLDNPWGQLFSVEEIQAALAERPAKVVAIVHGETSTGACQPIEGIADVVHAQGGVLIVDTVASLGGVPFKVDELGVDVCYTGSQKCLSCPPGLAPITFSPLAMQKIEHRETPVLNWYLDVGLIQNYWNENRAYHHTGPVTMQYAMHESLRLVAEEGLEARWVRHKACAEMLWAGLEDLGLSLIVPAENRLISLTTVAAPEGYDEAAIRKQLLTETNIEIAGGLGELKGKGWRVGLMGYSAREENVLLLLAALKKILG
ncbi:pyridoxal-phosphate-dependent aminotransferase family protein [Chloroflexota bacterium]